MKLATHSLVRAAAALVALSALALPLAIGCSNEMDPKECDKLRGDSFDLVNLGQTCSNDGDCRQSDWPGCAKPISQKTYDKIKPMKDSFTKGKCPEPKSDCKEPPEVYCKTGLCVHREKGTPEGAGNTPLDQIQIK